MIAAACSYKKDNIKHLQCISTLAVSNSSRLNVLYNPFPVVTPRMAHDSATNDGSHQRVALSPGAGARPPLLGS